MMRRFYKTREKCERAIGRMFKNGRPQAWDLEPAYNERRKKWYPRIVFTLRTRVNATADALADVREKFRLVSLKCGAEEEFEVRRYINEALNGAIVALGEIEALFKSGEATENSECGIRNSESDPSTPLRSAQDDTAESEAGECSEE